MQPARKDLRSVTQVTINDFYYTILCGYIFYLASNWDLQYDVCFSEDNLL